MPSTDLLIGYLVNVFSVEVLYSQMTLACVRVKNQNKIQELTNMDLNEQ